MVEVLDYNNDNERMLIPPFVLSPRSQAIYGSSVETFGPYPQYYTMYTINNCVIILSYSTE